MVIGTFGHLGIKGLRGRLRLALLVILVVSARAQDPPDASQLAQNTAPADYDSASTPTAPGQPADPRFRLHAYADLDFSHNQAAGEPNHFSVGEIDLFGTAAVAPGFTALTEVAIDTDTTPTLTSVPVNVERLLLQYSLNEYLKIEAGQFRTAVGYYSTAYLRGAWFQTAISRPRLFAFEEDGGILPLHTVGVSVSGEIPSGFLGLHYVVETGNTRTWGTPVDSPTPANITGHDAVNVSTFARPPSVPGLELGVSDYHDLFSPIVGLTANRSGVTMHAVYVANRFEFLNEGVVAHIHYGPASATGTFAGFYSQLAYRIGSNWGPYARVERLTIHADPFFSGISYIAPWRSMYTAGVRYDWNDHVAVKLELGHEADWGAPHYYQAALQVAFAY